MLEKNYLSKNLEYLLKLHHKQQKDIAILTHKNKSTVNTWINRGVNPPLSCLIQIADYFTVSIDELVSVDLEEIQKESVEILLKKMINSPTLQSVFPSIKESNVNEIYTLMHLIYKKRAANE